MIFFFNGYAIFGAPIINLFENNSFLLMIFLCCQQLHFFEFEFLNNHISFENLLIKLPLKLGNFLVKVLLVFVDLVENYRIYLLIDLVYLPIS